MSYQDSTARLAAASEAAILAAYVSMPETDFIPTAAGTVATYNSWAYSLADIALATVLRAMSVGLTLPATERDRLEQSFSTLVQRIADDDPPTARAKVARIARAEPLQAGRRAYHQGMEAHRVPGWTRKARPDACELCTSLADGSVLPTTQPMFDHPGCNCIAVPVMEER